MKTLLELPRATPSHRGLRLAGVLLAGALVWHTLPAWAGNAAVRLPPPQDRGAPSAATLDGGSR